MFQFSQNTKKSAAKLTNLKLINNLKTYEQTDKV
jgi:hypothetical protein